MADGMTVDWGGTDRAMAGRIDAYGRNLISAIYRLAEEWATRIANDARGGAPWTDRTGAARQRLFGRAVRLATGAVIIVGHGVHYGIYLERRWGGRYAAIIPALQRAFAAVMASLQRLVA
jgi:hypothetical protein